MDEITRKRRPVSVSPVLVCSYPGNLTVVYTMPDDNGNATIVECLFGRAEKIVGNKLSQVIVDDPNV